MIYLLSIKARYERSVALIFAEAKDESGIAKIELIYKEEIKGTVNNPTGEVEFSVPSVSGTTTPSSPPAVFTPDKM